MTKFLTIVMVLCVCVVAGALVVLVRTPIDASAPTQEFHYTTQRAASEQDANDPATEEDFSLGDGMAAPLNHMPLDVEPD